MTVGCALPRPINHGAVVAATVRETSRVELEIRLGALRAELARRAECEDPRIISRGKR